jgi:hypothetical protein
MEDAKEDGEEVEVEGVGDSRIALRSSSSRVTLSPSPCCNDAFESIRAYRQVIGVSSTLPNPPRTNLGQPPPSPPVRCPSGTASRSPHSLPAPAPTMHPEASHRKPSGENRNELELERF